MKKLALLATLLAPVLAVVFLSIHLSILVYKPSVSEQKLFQIKPGEGFSQINYRLHQEKIIDYPRVFHYLTKFQGSLTKFKAGTFEIKKSASMMDVLTTLTEGTPHLISVTIPEGKNLYEIAKIMEERGITNEKEFIRLAKDKEFIKNTWNKEAPSIEGYLFPDTYRFSPESPAQTVINVMIQEFKNKTQGLDFSVTNLTPHEVINLASIVEKETGAKFERPIIAGVYLNRLKKKMRLQADPTTIYGIWENFDGNLRRKHLQETTDYNTYRLPALPLGPIANPSLEAIKAVLVPDKHNYIFFVSKNDGTHVFTETYKEHLEAVNYWQRNRRNREGKSWRNLNQ